MKVFQKLGSDSKFHNGNNQREPGDWQQLTVHYHLSDSACLANVEPFTVGINGEAEGLGKLTASYGLQIRIV